jgi:hypothetical protein
MLRQYRRSHRIQWRIDRPHMQHGMWEGFINSYLPEEWFGVDSRSYVADTLWRGAVGKGFRSYTIKIGADGRPTLEPDWISVLLPPQNRHVRANNKPFFYRRNLGAGKLRPGTTKNPPLGGFVRWTDLKKLGHVRPSRGWHTRLWTR